MVIRVAHVSVVEKPNISHVKNLIAILGKELLKVFNWLDQIREPNQSRKIVSLALQELTSELNGPGIVLLLGLYYQNIDSNCFTYLN